MISITLLLINTNLFATEPTAYSILNKAYNYIGSLDKYAFQAVVIEEDTRDKSTDRFDISVKVNKPYKLRIDTTCTRF